LKNNPWDWAAWTLPAIRTIRIQALLPAPIVAYCITMNDSAADFTRRTE
jgi:hypothetical protein